MKLQLTLAITMSLALQMAVSAQEFGIPASVLANQTFQRNLESQIVIRVRSTSDRQNLCGSGFDLSRLGVATDGFDFPHPGSRTGYDFPRPSGSSANYFQLPSGAKNPDIIGCVDPQRNILFINIFRQIQSSNPAQNQPIPVTPSPEPTYQTEPTIPKPFSPNYPGIKP